MNVTIIAVAVAGAISLLGAGADLETVTAIRTTGQARERYLAHAAIWHTPPDLSPAELLTGPRNVFPYPGVDATADEEIACTFARPGNQIGGATAKFLCRTADGRDLRLKYWDARSHSGNREVFATVAASRLMWALGFNAVQALAINVTCRDCPEDPMSGTGSRAMRRYVATLQQSWPPPIISSDNLDQGWSWRELDLAIRSLPAGAARLQQRTYFDALALLGVFIQHGDRKAEQQRLYCSGPLDDTAGTLQNAPGRTAVLRERQGSAVCPVSAVTILDTGATFGGAGRTSNGTTATMNLRAWQNTPVFRKSGGVECHGNLTDSLRAGGDGEPNPIVSEPGRRFLLEQLHRLTTDHVRAIFRAARVDVLDSQDAQSIDAWVAAFEDKIRQIEGQRCQPIDNVG